MGIVTLIVLILLYALGVVLTTVLVTQPRIMAMWFPATMYMGTTLQSMLTLLQVATLDSWAAVARPLCLGKVCGCSLLRYNWAPLALLTMVLSVVIISFGTFNILVAIMVERISTMATDREEILGLGSKTPSRRRERGPWRLRKRCSWSSSCGISGVPMRRGRGR